MSQGSLALAETNRLGFSAALEVAADDNFGFAPDDASERELMSAKASATVSYQVLAAPQRSLNVAFTPYYRGVGDLEDLSSYGAEIRGTFNQSFLIGRNNAYVRGLVAADFFEFEDSEPRDGHKLLGEVAFGYSITPRFTAEVGYRAQRRDQREDRPEGTLNTRETATGPIPNDSSAVFDTETDGPFARVTYGLTARGSLSAEFLYTSGTETATGNARAFNSPERFDSIRDFAFEEGTRFLAWNIETDTQQFTVSYSHELSERFTVSVSARHQSAQGEAGNDYDNTSVALRIARRF